MDRRKRLATAGAVSLSASAAIVALASGVGLFGLTNDGARVGKLSPIDATQPTQTTAATVPATGATAPATASGTRHDGADDPANHDANDDRSTSSPTTITVPGASDAHVGDDSREPASSDSDVDHHGPVTSGSGSDHDDD